MLFLCPRRCSESLAESSDNRPICATAAVGLYKMNQLLVFVMLRRLLMGAFVFTAVAGTSATAQEVNETKAEQTSFDYSTLTVQDEIAQTQPIASEEKAPVVVAAEAVGPDQASLAKAAQNPIASMISIPFQWNATPGTQWAPNSVDPDAKHDRVMNVVNVQPVFPFKLSDDWTLVTRTIVPFINCLLYTSPSPRDDR